jgi:HSP20 family protein
MTLVRRVTPFENLVSLRETMDRLFDETLFRPLRFGDGKHGIYPLIDLYTTPDAVIAEIALPGLKLEEVDISMTEDLVTITGTFEEPKEAVERGYVYKEIVRGTFSRSFTIPTLVKFDEARATFKDGLLILTMPKAEVAKPKHVKVEVR